MFRDLKQKRGTSPILSTLLLLAITVVGMSAVIGYSTNIISHQSAQMGERLVIEKVFFEPTQITMWVRNIGQEDLTIIEALVNESIIPFPTSVKIPSPAGNPAGYATELVISGTYTPGVYHLALFTSRANKLGIIDVEYL